MNVERVDGLWVRPEADATDHSVLAEQRIDIYRIHGRSLEGKVVVDLGANIGAVSVACARAGAARVIAVEPEPSNLTVLHLNAAEWPTIEVYECAVGGEDGRVDMVGRSGGAHALPGKSVPEKTLPGLLIDAAITDIAFLKIDIEGAEYDVLRETPHDVLCRVEYIAMEVHGPEVCPWVDRDHRWEIIDMLSPTHRVEHLPTLVGLANLYAERRP